jgi:hypothetical protein
MVAWIRHSMISKYHKRGLIVHQLHHFLDDMLRIDQLSLDLWMRCIKWMPSAINANNVSKHKVKLAPLF